MKKVLVRNIIISFLMTLSLNFAKSNQQFGYIGALKLTNGSEITDCRIGYRTFGILDDEKSNAVLFPTWFGGTSGHIGSLIEKHNFIDTTKYFIIAVDALSNGISSSPTDTLRDSLEFPLITIRDMVNSQYILLNEILMIHHLHAIVGGSMGSMQVFEWLVAYPHFMDKALPYVASPHRTTYDQLVMDLQIEIIESFEGLENSEERTQKILNRLTAIQGRTPDYIVENITQEKLESYLLALNSINKVFTVANYKSQLLAMKDFNIFEYFEGSMEIAADAVKAEVFMILSSTDHLVHPLSALEFARHLNCEVLILENNCGHLAIGCEMEKSVNAINEFLAEK